ncbi:Homoserine dehydrogenase [Minicystis rosea]|nr:Homoserine dehydrogenase [Minicystis rosea]
MLHDNARYLGERVGVPLEVRRILVRDLEKERVPEADRSLLTTSAEAVIEDPEIDMIVEVMGGEDPAGALIERAIAQGKGVVTANKMLLAHRGPRLLDMAVEQRVDLAFEGAVGGGIPIIRTLRDSFASDWVESLCAIINGTCNYVLTRMREGGVSLDVAIREAQAKGYAEADPTLDVDGHDAAHKLVVLAMLAFGARVDQAKVSTEGIRTIDEVDHRFAERFGYVIKHLAVGRDLGDAIELRVHPAFVPKSSMLANVSGVLNAVLLHGRALGPCLVYGRGAGDLPTAVSVVSDILDVARSIIAGVAGLQTRAISMGPRPMLPMSEVVSRYYLRFPVADRPGVMARLAGALGDAGVSIEQIVQEGGAESSGDGKPVDVVMITHRAREGAIRAAFEAIAKEGFVMAPARLLRIEER